MTDYLSESLTPISILADAIPFLVPLVSSFLPKGAFSKKQSQMVGHNIAISQWPIYACADISGQLLSLRFYPSQKLLRSDLGERDGSELSGIAFSRGIIKDVAGMVFIGTTISF